jgi:tetratricopeptide (TPR) repeat protein
MNPLTNDPPGAPSVLTLDGPPEVLTAPAPAEPSAVALAYAEFWRLRADGEAVDTEEFCNRYPGIRSAVRQMLDVDDFVGGATGLFDSFPPRPYPAAGEYVCGCKLLRELGRGAFSAVFLAHDDEGNRPVVLKLSDRKTGEGRVLGRLKHDNVVPLLWANQDPDSGWYVVRTLFFGAATLTHVLDRLYRVPEDPPPDDVAPLFEAIKAAARPDDPPPSPCAGGPSLVKLSLAGAAARLGGALASALAYLHAEGFAHGDVKPANVLLQADGQPLLLDFNLSQAAIPEGVGGTFPYMSPEHLRAFRDKKLMPPDEAAASDVYSLGVVLFELLTGRLPYGHAPGTTHLERAEALLVRQQTPHLALRDLNPEVPPRLAALIERCLSGDLAARPTARQLADALTPRPRRLLVGGVLVLVLSVVLGAAAWAAMPLSEGAARERGQMRFEQAQLLLAAGKPDAARERFKQADRDFDRAIQVRARAEGKGAAEDYFNRGRVLLALENTREAINCFLQAHEAHLADDRPHGPTLAYLSYCYSIRGEHRTAAAFGEQALKADYRTAAVLNNLGHARLRQADADRADQGKRAEVWELLSEAIRLDPNGPAAYRNRAEVVFRPALTDQKIPVSDDALLDVEAAVALSREPEFGESSQLAWRAAQFYGLALRNEPSAPWLRRLELIRLLQAHAVRARELGTPLRALQEDALVTPWLPADLGQVEQKRPDVNALWTHLVEPVPDR